MTITLTPEQDAALDAVSRWYTGQTEGMVREPFRLFGPAGTGKTTLARHLAERLGLHRVVFGAYTGKAAQVLRSKGVDATTIHSAIYQPKENAETRVRWQELTTAQSEELMNPNPDPAYLNDLAERIAELEEILRQPGFILNPMSEWGYADLIVLDEVSMVNGDMAADIESFGVPVLVLGDPFQLPPVFGTGHYTDHEPDVLLTEIHRQALESPVLRLATEIRLAGASGVDGPHVIWKNQREIVSVSKAMQFDQVLCWRNATRWRLTEAIRAKLERPAGRPVPGDRVMCLVNNKRDLGVLNGQQFDVLDVAGDVLLVQEAGTEAAPRWIEAHPDGWTKDGEAKIKGHRLFRGGVGAFTFANVVTVHKAQGSEWGSVYIVDETRPMIEQEERRGSRAAAREQARRWLYTAVTRAKDSVQLARLRSG